MVCLFEALNFAPPQTAQSYGCRTCRCRLRQTVYNCPDRNLVRDVYVEAGCRPILRGWRHATTAAIEPSLSELQTANNVRHVVVNAIGAETIFFIWPR